MKLENKAIIYLIGVTAFWGMTFPLIRIGLAYVGPNTFVTARFVLAAVFFLPIVWNRLRKANKQILGFSVILGLFNTGVYVFQTIGLQTTSSANAAFITAINVALIPLIMPFFKLGRPNRIQIICSLISLFGIYILTGANLHNITVGDCWILGCAISTALSVCMLQFLSTKTQEFRLVTFLQIIFLIPIPLVLSHPEGYTHLFAPPLLLSLLFCAIFATCIAYYWEFKWQSKTTAAKAALIYALEPVFATIFAWLINGEVITTHIIIGGVIILASLLISEFSPLFIIKRKE